MGHSQSRFKSSMITWNMDEAGTALGICTNSMVLGDSQKKRTYVQSHRDVYHMIQTLDNGHMTQRETRAILGKAGKRIGQLAAQNAVSESKIHSLEAQLEELRGPKTRKRVVVDPNTKFANIDAIKKAMDEATEQEARIKAREPEKEAKKTADELTKAKMQDFMFEWQAI